MPKVVIFDFDGVLVDSVPIKTRAFRHIFAKYPEQLEAIQNYHLSNGGLSRDRKISHIYEKILKEPLTEKKWLELSGDFHNYVMEKVIAAPYIKGAEALLNHSVSEARLYVVSGTPEDEMREIVKRRGMGRFFKGVYGSPRLKAELIQEVIAQEKCSANEVVFLGDSINDLEAAKSARIAFIAIASDKSASWLQDPSVSAVFPDLRNVKEFLNLNRNRTSL